ncbi:MAG: class I mannose-6-phosphate isomerase [Bacilli bacterium]|jgi:mannose-6-phosphate isomerase|nr:class I mannose-6-phosphate isomerase [Bacilli bacterium]
MKTVKLKPATKDYIWGGTKFFSWGKETNADRIAECWELSFRDEGPSLIDSGINKGKRLKDVASQEDIGSLASSFPFFPMLVKLINAKDNLSIQVHPSDDHALKNEKSYGKTEMWYILEAEKDALLYIGFNRDVSKKEIIERITNNTLLEVLNAIKVQPGECYFIPSGTPHTIGKGITLLEVQQNSNLTYRLYDYARIGKDGKPRELHIEKALKVMDFNKFCPIITKEGRLGYSPYFSTYKNKNDGLPIIATKESFIAITISDGSGTINEIPFSKGNTFFIPAGQQASINGKCTYLMMTVEKQ